MSKKPIEHVVLGIHTPERSSIAPAGAGFVCRHCEATAPIATGINLHLLQKHAAAFTLMHEDCEKPSRQLSFSGVPELMREKNRVLSEFDRELDRAERSGPVGVSFPQVTHEDGDSSPGAIQAQTMTEWPLCPATTWLDLWEDLAGALMPQEWQELHDWTPLPDMLPVDSAEWAQVAAWAWHEVHAEEGVLQSRPLPLAQCIEWSHMAAVQKHAATCEPCSKPTPAPAKRQHHKRPALHIHASNDTIPAKPRAHTVHAIVGTVDQADALRSGSYSKVKVHDSVLWETENELLAYTVDQVLAPMHVAIDMSIETRIACNKGRPPA